MPEPLVPHSFLSGCRNAIIMMRDAGLNTTQIACILQDVRSTTLSEEYRRIKNLLQANPPYHHSLSRLLDDLREIANLKS